jgi:hypothetical protein
MVKAFEKILEKLKNTGTTLKELTQIPNMELKIREGKYGLYCLLVYKGLPVNASFGKSIDQDIKRLNLDNLQSFINENASILKMKYFHDEKTDKSFLKIYKVKTKNIIKENLN